MYVNYDIQVEDMYISTSNVCKLRHTSRGHVYQHTKREINWSKWGYL